MGPRGLNLLPESLLSFLDPAVSAALAAVGALAGLALYRDRRREPALLGSVVADSGLAIVVVSACAAAVWRAAGLPAAATLIASVCLGIAAVLSSPGLRNSTHPLAPLVGRISGLGAAIAIVLGALVLAWLPRQSPAGTLWNIGELCAIAAMIGFAGGCSRFRPATTTSSASSPRERAPARRRRRLPRGVSAVYRPGGRACWRAAGRAATIG